MPIPRGVADLHARFCGTLTHRYFIRVHMGVLLALVLLSGALASRLLLGAGIVSMGVRYPLAVLISYLVFFGLVRLWVAYICAVGGLGLAASKSRRDGADGDLLDGAGWGGGSGGGSSSGGGSGGRWLGGGGGSGGGGSSGGFGDAEVAGARPAMPLPLQSDGPSGGSGGGHGFFSRVSGGSGGGGGGDGDGLLLLILFALLVVAIFGAGAYLVYQAPAILSEAAFQAVLAGGLIRTARGAHDPGWAGSVFKATVIPFTLVLVLSGVFGHQAHKRCPSARTAHEVMRTCVLS